MLNWGNASLDDLKSVEQKKHLQKTKIIRYLYLEGHKSNADIYQQLSISSPTSVTLINELIQDDWIESKGRGESSGGRKPILFGLKQNALFMLGIEIRKYKIRMALFNSYNENISGIFSYPIHINDDQLVLHTLLDKADQMINTSGLNKSKFMGLGINMPGLIDSSRGINYTYLNAREQSFVSLLKKHFQQPVYLENDAKAITLAEYRFGLAQGKKDVLVLNLDWGIGLGILQGGRVYRGANGFSGEFSHIPIIEEGQVCNCGKTGCLETVASGTALSRLAKTGIEAGKSSILQKMADPELDKIDPSIVVEAALKGDQYAVSIISEVGFNLGRGISILIQLFNPEMIILGGKLAEADQYLITPIKQALNVYCMPQLRDKTTIARSNLGQEAGILGSVAMLMENLFESIIE